MLTPLTWTDMFSATECDAVVRLAHAGGLREAGLVRGRQNESIRSARIAWLDDEGEAAWVFERVTGTVIAANRQHFGLDLTDFAERVQIAFYDAEACGHFDWHSDIGGGTLAERRKLTLVAQLSASGSYTGGTLELNVAGQVEAAERGRGTATLFPSFTPHRVTDVVSGARYSLTTWTHGPAFR